MRAIKIESVYAAIQEGIPLTRFFRFLHYWNFPH
jgi:hypothetical protein